MRLEPQAAGLWDSREDLEETPWGLQGAFLHQRLESWEPWAWPTLGAGRADSSSRSCRPQGLQPALPTPPAPRGPLRSPYLRQRPGWQRLPHCCHLDPCQHQPWPCMGGLASCAWRPRAGSPRVAPACLPCARAGQQRPPHPVGTASSCDHGVFIGPVSTCVYFHYSFYFYRLFYQGFSLPCTSILYSKSLLHGCVRPGAPAAALPGATVSRGPARLPARGPARPSPALREAVLVSLHCVDRGSQGNTRPNACVITPTPCAALPPACHGASSQGRLGGSLPGHSVLSHVAASPLMHTLPFGAVVTTARIKY